MKITKFLFAYITLLLLLFTVNLWSQSAITNNAALLKVSNVAIMITGSFTNQASGSFNHNGQINIIEASIFYFFINNRTVDLHWSSSIEVNND